MAKLRSREEVDDSLIDESGRVAIKWMVAMTSGDMTERQMRDFECWRNADPGNAEAWERMAGGLQPFCTLARSSLPLGSVSRMRPVVRRDRRAVLAGLAGFVVAGGAGTIVAQRFMPLEGLLSDHHTKTAEHERVHLGDSSEIVLAPRSSVNVAMTPETRGLEFAHGKMMLQISESDPRRFIINLGRIQFETSAGTFVMNRNNDYVTVTSVSGTGTARTIVGNRFTLRERERLVVRGSDVIRRPVDIEAASSWVSGFLAVRDESVVNIIDEIRPYYPGFIRISPNAGSYHATGVFNLFNPVASLSALAQSVGLKMVRVAGFWIQIDSAAT